jgi:hypothetical protein
MKQSWRNKGDKDKKGLNERKTVPSLQFLVKWQSGSWNLCSLGRHGNVTRTIFNSKIWKPDGEITLIVSTSNHFSLLTGVFTTNVSTFSLRKA